MSYYINPLNRLANMSYHLNNFLRTQISNNDFSYLYLLHLIKSKKGKKLTKNIFTELGDLEKLKRRVIKYVNRYREHVDPETEIVRDGASAVLTELKSIQVKNFRGFSSLNENDEGTLIPFTKGVNVFFAPNGGGKTSLCEVIEYSLTHDVKEASRRNTLLKNYIKNGGPHKIQCKLTNDGDVPVSSYWNSCFIDRNRLQEFSLLGSKDTNVKQSDVLAILFELEEIDEIINGMVKPPSFKASEFIRTLGESNHKAAVDNLTRKKALRRDEIRHIRNTEFNLAEIFGLTQFDSVNVESRKAYFTKLRSGLVTSTQQFESASEELHFDKLTNYIDSIYRLNNMLEEKRNKLSVDASALNYQKLYNAIKGMDDISALEYCPACQTPIDKVYKHPRDVVKDELPKLDHLSQLTSACNTIQKQIQLRVDTSASYIQKCLNEHKDALSVQLKTILERISTCDKNSVSEYVVSLSKIVPHLKEIEHLNNAIKAKNNRVDTQAARLISLNSKIELIEDKLRSCTVFETDITARKRTLKSLNGEIINILSDIAKYKAQIVKDNNFNEFAINLEASYKKLYNELNSYKQQVEEENISGIELSTLSYYNQINKHDAPSDLVSEIKFKQANGTYRIILKMQNDKEDDAFCVLSEGHLRALGLALLLSVAKKNCHPIIIFDDVVNAIDTEHRSNIIDMFSEDSYLKNTQRIITTHDRMFWEKISNKNKKATDADTFSSNVLKSTNRGIVIRNFGVSYSQKIKDALEVYDVRQALVYSRVWFETMVNEYCVNNEIQVTTQFTSRQLKKDNWLEISLEATYAKVSESLGENVATFNFLKNDLINWGAQNQEHHAFDEYNYNFSHSTTSVEVQSIYEKLWVLEAQFKPNEIVEKLNREKSELETTKHRLVQKLSNDNFVERAPQEIVQASRDNLSKVDSDLDLLNRILEQV